MSDSKFLCIHVKNDKKDFWIGLHQIAYVYSENGGPYIIRFVDSVIEDTGIDELAVMDIESFNAVMKVVQT